MRPHLAAQYLPPPPPPPPAVSKTLACFRIDFSLKSSHSEINEVLVGTYHWSMSCFAALAQDK